MRKFLILGLLVLSFGLLGSSGGCGGTTVTSIGVEFEPNPEMGAPESGPVGTRLVAEEEPPPATRGEVTPPCRWWAERQRCMRHNERRVMVYIGTHRGQAR